MGSFDKIFEAEEYKDLPLAFRFVLDGREEAVKLVEPEVDLPFPNDGTLLVERGEERRICDMVFVFDPTERHPCQLRFNAMLEMTYDQLQQATFGPVSPDKDRVDLAAVYQMDIVDDGGVQARIEMSDGKARLHVTYHG